MRCKTICTADVYLLSKLREALLPYGLIQTHRDVIHLQYKNQDTLITDLFFFDFGVSVFWNLPEESEVLFLRILNEFSQEIYAKPEKESYSIALGDKMQVEADLIIIDNKNILTKLAVSFGLAQSAKLTVFETKIEATIASTKHLPHELATKGKIPLSRRDISRKIGAIYIDRSSINLHTEILDIPEFFWEHPNLDIYYHKITHYLETKSRTEILNNRLRVLHELFEILSNELDHRNSHRLEWIIIFLILLEVLLAILHDVLALF